MLDPFYDFFGIGAGAMSAALEKHTSSGVPDSVSGTSQYAEAIDLSEITERTAQRWQQQAKIVEKVFEAFVGPGRLAPLRERVEKAL